MRHSADSTLTRLVGVLAVVLVLLPGCSGQADINGLQPATIEQALDGGVVDASCIGRYGPTWENFGDGFVRNYCRGCHSPALGEGDRWGAPVGVDLATHDDILRQMDRVRARASGDNPTMPPAGGPSPEDLELLHTWLECGAP